MNLARIALFERDPEQAGAISDALHGTPYQIIPEVVIDNTGDALQIVPKLKRLGIDLVILDVNLAKGQRGFHAAEVIQRSLIVARYEGKALGIRDDEAFWEHNIHFDREIPRHQIPLLPEIIKKQL